MESRHVNYIAKTIVLLIVFYEKVRITRKIDNTLSSILYQIFIALTMICRAGLITRCKVYASTKVIHFLNYLCLPKCIKSKICTATYYVQS